jgi:hypothetical protein
VAPQDATDLPPDRIDPYLGRREGMSLTHLTLADELFWVCRPECQKGRRTHQGEHRLAGAAAVDVFVDRLTSDAERNARVDASPVEHLDLS